MRRLLPEVRETTLDDELASLDLVAMAHEDRPYLITNFVLTIDGRATLGGHSGPIGSEVDTSLLVGLRTIVDGLMIGGGTMRAERYGRVVPDPSKRARRERRGLAHDPLAIVVSGRLDLPWDAGLFTCGQGRALIFTATDAEPPQVPTPTRIERHRGSVDLVEAMRLLRQELGIRALLCEGGPTLHAELIEAGLVDELFITHAPKLGGGEGPHLVSGLAEHERQLELTSLLHEASSGELFARYRLTEPG